MVENKLCNWAVRGKFEAIEENTMPGWEAKLLERVRMHDEALLLDGVPYEDRKVKLKNYADRLRLMTMPAVSQFSAGGA
jgi:hypothetical protein